jgi:hypothetical protein
MRARPFFAGLFLLCMSILLTQIVQTRLLSVIGRYYLAFFSISMAMFGMTAGALWIHFNHKRFSPETLAEQLAGITLLYCLSLLICTGFELASAAPVIVAATVIFIWLKMILLLVPPFVLGGMAVSLALTRSPFRIGLVYGVDLLGAATGCLVAIVLLDLLDGPSAMIAIAAIIALAACCFALASRTAAPNPIAWLPRVTVFQAGRFAVMLAVLAVVNASTPAGFRLIASKDHIEDPADFAFEKWNSFSRIMATRPIDTYPLLIGRSPIAPTDFSVRQMSLNIDGDAATTMTKWSGDPASLDFLKFDITTLAYEIRDHGRSAVIGVGGGRDVLSAYGAGFRDITAVELNPIFVDLLTNPRRFRDFAGIADLPGVRMFVDDGRSWFARTTEHFDLIQMSLVDTWAATGAGGFTLSENGLYTVEGWGHFLRALTPTGVFTVSRWYGAGYVYETGRLISLAVAALRAQLGVSDPRAHIFLAGQGALATLLVSVAPFTPAELARLHAMAEHYQQKILASPDQPPADDMIGGLLAAPSMPDLLSLASTEVLDVSPATDARPFFFNMLRLDPFRFVQAARLASGRGSAVVRGNLFATGTLFLIIILSVLLVAATILLPMRDSVRAVDRRLAAAGTAYFALIGLGFMFVEIGVIQRISVFLGHPVYALSVGLFSIILATGIGSFASERVVLRTPLAFVVWAILLAGYLALLPQWFPAFTAAQESASIWWRGLICVAAIAPAGILMGFGFPTGMRLVNAIDARPTAWFWGVNGAAGVLGSGMAVACSISTSIDMTLRLGALAYLVLAVAGLPLLARRGSLPIAAPTAGPAAG